MSHIATGVLKMLPRETFYLTEKNRTIDACRDFQLETQQNSLYSLKINMWKGNILDITWGFQVIL